MFRWELHVSGSRIYYVYSNFVDICWATLIFTCQVVIVTLLSLHFLAKWTAVVCNDSWISRDWHNCTSGKFSNFSYYNCCQIYIIYNMTVITLRYHEQMGMRSVVFIFYIYSCNLFTVHKQVYLPIVSAYRHFDLVTISCFSGQVFWWCRKSVFICHRNKDFRI